MNRAKIIWSKFEEYIFIDEKDFGKSKKNFNEIIGKDYLDYKHEFWNWQTDKNWKKIELKDITNSKIGE